MTQSKDNSNPSVDLSMALEEYKEALAHLRHQDQLSWTILGLSFTAAFGLWAYTFKDPPFLSGKSLALSGLGVVVLVLGRLMVRRLTDFTKSLWNRAEELERRLGFQLMSRMRKTIPKSGAPRITLLLDLIAVGALAGWFVYLAVFICRLG